LVRDVGVKNHTPMYFCDGLVDDIRTSLSKLAGLRVIAQF
jgi:TolB-like protein